MPNTVEVAYYPDEFDTTSEFIIGGNGSTIVANTNYPLLFAERDIIIDRITVSTAVVCGTNTTCDLKRTTSGTAASPASPSAASTAIASTITVNTVGTVNATLTTPASDTNVIRAGNFLCFTTGATWAATGAVLVSMRYRTRYA